MFRVFLLLFINETISNFLRKSGFLENTWILIIPLTLVSNKTHSLLSQAALPAKHYDGKLLPMMHITQQIFLSLYNPCIATLKHS